MGLITDALRIGNRAPIFPQSSGLLGGSQPQAEYQSFGRAYASNEIVFAAIELLASSAGEPHISGRRWRRESPTLQVTPRNQFGLGEGAWEEGPVVNRETLRALSAELRTKGHRRVNAWLARNGYVEELPNHPLVRLLNAPNPFMSRGQLWGTVEMDLDLAGNAYHLKVKAEPPFKPMPLELWRLRPDRVRVIPSKTEFIEGYEYSTGTEKIVYPRDDVIHYKTRNPLNDYYGMPPLMAIAGRVDIDQYMKSFLKTFFERGGAGPGSILSVKQRLSQENKDEIREKLDRQFGGPAGFHKTMVLDQAESTYQQLGLNRGLRDALPKELNAMQESRIAMAFGIPGSILGLLIGYESSSYANKRQDWQVLWDVTMAPRMSDRDDALNLSLVSDFSQIDEVYFDLDDIKALQEDVDAIQERERKNFVAGAIPLEEFRDAIGRDPNIKEGTFLVPTNAKYVDFKDLTKEPEPAPVFQPEEEEPEEEVAVAAIVPIPRCSTCGSGGFGRNIQEGAKLFCRKCRREFTVVVD